MYEYCIGIVYAILLHVNNVFAIDGALAWDSNTCFHDLPHAANAMEWMVESFVVATQHWNEQQYIHANTVRVQHLISNITKNIPTQSKQYRRNNTHHMYII